MSSCGKRSLGLRALGSQGRVASARVRRHLRPVVGRGGVAEPQWFSWCVENSVSLSMSGQ